MVGPTIINYHSSKRISPVKMATAVVNFKKNCSFLWARLASLEAPLENAPKKSFFKLNHWRFSRKAKYLMAVAIAVVLLVSAFAFLPKQTNGKSDVAAQGGGNSTATSSPTATATVSSLTYSRVNPIG